MSGDHQDCRQASRIKCTNVLDGFPTVHAGHDPVDAEDVERLPCGGCRFQPLDGFGTTCCRLGLPAEGGDHGGEYFASRGIVIDDQHTQGRLPVIFRRHRTFQCTGCCVAAKIDGEMKVAALAGCAFHHQIPPHQAHQATADRQAQTGAAEPSRG